MRSVEVTRAPAVAVARRLAVVFCAAVIALAVAAASADAESPLEGVWSFNGGRVAIQAEPDGSLTGTVLSPTRFAECPHEIGERMWTDIRLQPDGSYWGSHQWFYDDSGCKPNPTLGATAWRVLSAGAGRYLRVCLSGPGESQPTIGAAGESADATFGCVDSARVSALPVASESEFFSGPQVCIAGNRLRVKIRNPKGNPVAQVTVAVKGGGIRKNFRLRPHPKSFVANLDITPIVAPTVRATVRLQTVLGAHLRQRRVYRRC
jgi:hypothetical protein